MQTLLKAPVKSNSSHKFIDTCTCCGLDFYTSSDQFDIDNGVCQTCDAEQESKTDTWSDIYINSAIKQLEAKGGQDELIKKIKGMTRKQKNNLALKLANK